MPGKTESDSDDSGEERDTFIGQLTAKLNYGGDGSDGFHAGYGGDGSDGGEDRRSYRLT